MVLSVCPAKAEVQPGSPIFIVNLAAAQRGYTIVRASTLDEALESLQPAATNYATAKGDHLDFLLTSCQPTESGAPLPVTPIVQRLYDCADCLAAYRETRFITRRGDTVVLIVLYDANVIADNRGLKVAFSEAPRDSELLATGKALVKLTQKETQPKAAPACIAFTYTLQHKRSHLKVSLSTGSAATTAPAAAADPLLQPGGGRPAAPLPPVVESPQVVLGPHEHWFFSADFSISKASVKVAKTPTVPDEAIKSKDFFVALNFAVADLLADREGTLQRRSFWKEFVIKGQVTPSREPWTAWAVGLGVRGYRVRAILWNMDVAHPYVTIGRQALDGEARKWRVVAGIGFDPRSLQK